MMHFHQMVPYDMMLAMGRRLDEFPGDAAPAPRRYPWAEWTDGSVWEIRRGEDYDVSTENMRVNLHMKADQSVQKVRTKKVRDEQQGEGLVFQFFDPEAEEARMKLATLSPDEAQTALALLYEDAIEIYERARTEVLIDRSDGTRQKYAAVRYKQQVDKGWEKGELVPTIAKIVRKPTLGFGHLEKAERPDLMVETLVLNEAKPYHRFFTVKTVETARERMRERGYLD
jgi:hypothetical protein